MSEYGAFKVKQREIEMEHEAEDMESDYFGEFLAWTLACVAIMLAGIVGTFALNWLESFGRVAH